MVNEHRPVGRVLTGISHGGHVLTEDSAEAARLAATQETITLAEAADVAAAVEFSTPFDYLFADLAAEFPNRHLPNDNPAAVVATLKTLGGAMVEDPPPAADPLQPLANSTIPPIYTYWGQFIDHDLTANTDRDSEISDITRPDLTPQPPAVVAEQLRNLRQPALNLDSVYGDGPSFEGQPPPKRPTSMTGSSSRSAPPPPRATTPTSPSAGSASPPRTTWIATCPGLRRRRRSPMTATTKT